MSEALVSRKTHRPLSHIPDYPLHQLANEPGVHPTSLSYSNRGPVYERLTPLKGSSFTLTTRRKIKNKEHQITPRKKKKKIDKESIKIYKEE